MPLPPAFTRAGFRETARSIRVHLDGEPAGFMAPTETPAGACGWKLAFTRPGTVAGCTVNIRYTLTATVLGSAEAPGPLDIPDPPPPPPGGADPGLFT